MKIRSKIKDVGRATSRSVGLSEPIFPPVKKWREREAWELLGWNLKGQKKVGKGWGIMTKESLHFIVILGFFEGKIRIETQGHRLRKERQITNLRERDRTKPRIFQ